MKYKDYLVQFGILIIGLVLYNLKAASFWGHVLPMRDTLSELGVALMIASVIGVTIEIGNRRRDTELHERHLSEVSQDVFKSLFGVSLDGLVLTELNETTFAQRFMRKNILIKYYFEPFTDDRSATTIRLRTTVQYELWNMGTQPRATEISAWFQTYIADHERSDKGEDKDEFLYAIIEVPGHEPVEYTRENVPSSSAGIRRTMLVTDLPKIPLSTMTRVKYMYARTIRLTDRVSYYTRLPTVNMSIEVEIRDSVPDLQLDLITAHSKPASTTYTPNELGRREFGWRIDGGILPYQGFELFWRPGKTASQIVTDPELQWNEVCKTSPTSSRHWAIERSGLEINDTYLSGDAYYIWNMVPVTSPLQISFNCKFYRTGIPKLQCPDLRLVLYGLSTSETYASSPQLLLHIPWECEEQAFAAVLGAGTVQEIGRSRPRVELRWDQTYHYDVAISDSIIAVIDSVIRLNISQQDVIAAGVDVQGSWYWGFSTVGGRLRISDIVIRRS